MKLYYTFSKGEEERYFKACDAMTEASSSGRIAALIQQKTGYYVNTQTIRDWFSEPGRIPTDVAVMVLVKNYDVKLDHICPWLKGYTKRKAS